MTSALKACTFAAIFSSLICQPALAQTGEVQPGLSDKDRDALTTIIEKSTDTSDGPGTVITILLAGDTGFSPNNEPVNAKGVRRHGQFQTWQQATSGIAGKIDGDLNFLNMETVVTTSNKLPRDTKGQRGPFNFRTHVEGARHLVAAGFNVISLANNHSMDYGVPGLRETLHHMNALRGDGLLAYSGIGMNREEASRPVAIDVKGAKIEFAATGIVTNNLERHRAGPDKPGQIAYRFDDDFKLITDRLSAAEADYRILSIHYGIEGWVRVDARQKKEWRGQAAIEKGIDLIVGHHAHVVRPVEIVGNSIIFYGLGNFLHHGTADMSGKGLCRSYGLLAKVHLLREPSGKLQPKAIEVLPVTVMHTRTRPYGNASDSHKRIHALNYLARDLDDEARGSKGVRFTPQPDGAGLYCYPGADGGPGRIGELCRNWNPAPAIPKSLYGALNSSCAK